MTNEKIGRRKFFEAAAGTAAFTILKPHLVRGMQANSAVRVGLLGCGGRGTTHAETILKNTDARLIAVADMFQDRIDSARKQIDGLSAAKGQAGVAETFVGPKAYQEIIESKQVDAVVIATPPYYHVEHLAAAVAAGKHVYCEKPVAIDVPGAKHVLEIGRKAEGRLSLDVGFQIRNAPPFVELAKRIHEGALGDIVSGAAYYYAPHIDIGFPDAPAPAYRLRNWIQDRALSGDIIVEQNIHAIDICNWMLQGHPLKAAGRSGRKGRDYPGDTCSSHFNLVFEYPNDVHVSFSSVQFDKAQFDCNERFYGTRGSSQSPYAGPLGIWGEQPWTWGSSEKPAAQGGKFSASGSFSDNLADADSEKQKAFFHSITSRQYHNQAAAGVESALSAMLGRQAAAYERREVSWDELLRSTERLDPGIDLNKL